MQNFRTYDLAIAFYRRSRALDCRGALKEQLDRAASSIALNLAEARGRPTLPDQKRFFHIAMGSLRECQAILTLADLENTEDWKMLDSLGAHIYKLIGAAG